MNLLQKLMHKYRRWKLKRYARRTLSESLKKGPSNAVLLGMKYSRRKSRRLARRALFESLKYRLPNGQKGDNQ